MPDTKAATAPTEPKAERTFYDYITTAERAVSNAAKHAADGPAKVELRKMALNLGRAKIDIEEASLAS